MTNGESGFVLIERFGQFVAEFLPQQWRRKHFDLCAKTQDVTQQLAFIGIRHFERVPAIGVQGAFLLRMPRLMAHPLRSAR
jgi:hypothetical protein